MTNSKELSIKNSDNSNNMNDIENAKKIQIFRVLLDFGNKINSKIDIKDIIFSADCELRRIIQYHQCTFAFKKGDSTYDIISYNPETKFIDEYTIKIVPEIFDPIIQLLMTNKVAVFKDLSPFMKVPILSDKITENTTQSILVIPMIKDDALIGSLVFESKEKDGFSLLDTEMLSAISFGLSCAISKSLLIAENINLQNFLNQVIESIGDPIFVNDKNGNVVMCNKAAEMALSFNRNDMIGKNLDILLADEVKNIRKKIKQQIKNGEKTVTQEIQYYTKEGHKKYSLTAVTPIYSKDGEIEYYVSLSKDITKLKRLEQDKQNFFSTFANNMKSPFSSIIGHTNSLLKENAGLNKKQQDTIEKIHHTSKQLLTMIDNFLLALKLESSNNFFASNSMVNLVDVLKEMTGLLENQLQEKEIQCEFLFDTDKAYVNGDVSHLQKIFGHFLGNVIKLNQASGKIRIDLKKDKNYYTVSIKDTSAAIPFVEKEKIEKEKIDTIFTQHLLDNTMVQEQIQQDGLGHYIAKNLVEFYNGKLEIAHTSGEGSTFSIHLPISYQEKYNLTPREAEILNYVLKGISNKGIAKELSLSENTVKTHLKNIFSKLGIKKRTELIAKFSKTR